MSDTISLRLPKGLSARLTQLAELTHRPKSFYVREALVAYLAQAELAVALDIKADAIRRGKRPTRSLDEVMDALGIAQADIDAAPLTPASK